MKFLVDVCAGHSLAEWLRLQNYDVVEVRDRDSKMADEDILAWAVSEERILVTMDKDFSELITIQAKNMQELFVWKICLRVFVLNVLPKSYNFMQKILRKKLLSSKKVIKYVFCTGKT
ncbi:DUF5615 family PIN-like protein [Candidatus Aerophobetes bacterium]|nr:DUF5615 family PIN-like protein [Candidatus Aerophobetes bacterium]